MVVTQIQGARTTVGMTQLWSAASHGSSADSRPANPDPAGTAERLWCLENATTTRPYSGTSLEKRGEDCNDQSLGIFEGSLNFQNQCLPDGRMGSSERPCRCYIQHRHQFPLQTGEYRKETHDRLQPTTFYNPRNSCHYCTLAVRPRAQPDKSSCLPSPDSRTERNQLTTPQFRCERTSQIRSFAAKLRVPQAECPRPL